jgi:uncharacterized membrane protein YccC
MSSLLTATNLRARWAAYQPRLRYGVRATIVALVAFWLGSVSDLPLHGIWVVLTAIVVTQMSAGGSVRASIEYMVGTLAGAIYAGVLGVALPHATPLALAGVLALTIAPLAVASAASPSFRAAPFSAVLVLLIAGQIGEGPVGSALLRVGEVALGAVIAVVVSFIVFPERAHSLAIETAVRILREMARVLPLLVRGCLHKLDPGDIRRIQDELGAAIASLQAITADASSERLLRFAADPDQAPLSRTLLRIRHDIVIIGRAAATPLPAALGQRLAPLLSRFAACASDFLRGCATALALRAPPPALGEVDAAHAAYTSELNALRRDALPTLSAVEAERIFALGFALEQLHREFGDLARCVRENARHRAGKAPSMPAPHPG